MFKIGFTILRKARNDDKSLAIYWTWIRKRLIHKRRICLDL